MRFLHAAHADFAAPFTKPGRIGAALALTAVLVSSGCGGGGGPLGAGPSVALGSFGPNAVSATYNAATGLFTFTEGGTILGSLAPMSTHDAGAFAHYHSPAPEARAYAAQTPNSIVALLASSGTTTDGFGGVSFRNLASTTLPASGAVTYHGDYAGFLRNETFPNTNISRLITGEATITANFTANSVSGKISDRLALYPADNRVDPTLLLNDVTLQSGTLGSGGGFSGAAEGGEISVGGWTQGVGTFSGQLTGPTGNEAAGAILMTHQSPAAVPFAEIGGFLAE